MPMTVGQLFSIYELLRAEREKSLQQPPTNSIGYGTALIGEAKLEEVLRDCQVEVVLPFEIDRIITKLVLSGVLDSIASKLAEKSNNSS